MALKKDLPHFKTAIAKHRTPNARIDLVANLQRHANKVSALMDCSDGLINDAMQLVGSGGLEVFADQLPLHPDTLQMAQHLALPSLDFALWGGEDYELLLAIAPQDEKFFPGF